MNKNEYVIIDSEKFESFSQKDEFKRFFDHNIGIIDEIIEFPNHKEYKIIFHNVSFMIEKYFFKEKNTYYLYVYKSYILFHSPSLEELKNKLMRYNASKNFNI